MRALVFSFLIGLILISEIALAENTLYQYEADIDLNSTLVSHIERKYIFYNSTFDEKFILGIEGDHQNLQVDSPVSCLQTEKNWGLQISCDISSMKGKNFNIVIKQDSAGYVSDVNGYLKFAGTYEVPVSTKNFIVVLKLPEGTGLIKERNESSINEKPFMPSNALVSSDGRRTILIWEKDDLPAGDSLDISVSFESFSTTVDYTKFINIQIIFIIVIILSLGAFYKFYWKKKTEVKVVMPILRKDEKIIIEKLLEHKGIINQKVLVKESNYSKAKISKVLKNLQERGMIHLERIGRTNKVHLKKEFKKEEPKKP